ncbi:MAG: formate dehydrogenase [Alphaproteobacteria bacterium]|nr:formate dehydrogenase [Alphaproteobacteria bacterium]
MKTKQAQPSRRGFFLGASAATAVAAVAAVSSPLTSSTQVVEEQPKPERGGGYKVSEHIQRYYRSARV